MCFTATTYTCGNLSFNILKLFGQKEKRKKNVVTKEEFI